MGAPSAAALAIARSKAARRVLLWFIVLFTLGVISVAVPLVTVIFIAGANSPASAATVHKTPTAAPAVTSGKWTYPLVGSYWKGRGFGPDPNAWSCAFCSKFHEGYDMAQGCGATVHAASAGRVTTAGNYFGYGNAVAIDHGHGITTLYGHMEWGSLRVHVGQIVSTGAPIGAEGSTGHSTGCHLHFEVRVHGTAVDPQPFMAARGLPLK